VEEIHQTFRVEMRKFNLGFNLALYCPRVQITPEFCSIFLAYKSLSFLKYHIQRDSKMQQSHVLIIRSIFRGRLAFDWLPSFCKEDIVEKPAKTTRLASG